MMWYRVDLSASLRSCGFAVEIFRVPGNRIVLGGVDLVSVMLAAVCTSSDLEKSKWSSQRCRPHTLVYRHRAGRREVVFFLLNDARLLAS